MKNIFLGNTSVLSNWISIFSDLTNLIFQFVDIEHSSYIEKLRQISQYEPQVLLVLVVDDNKKYDLEEVFASFNCIDIREFIKKTITESELMPSKIRLEASTICQLDCDDCYMRKNNYGTMGIGFLKFENFKKLIDDNPYISEIELSNSGEIFLNPDLDRIIKYAYEANVKLMAYNGTNFNNVSDIVLESMVKYKFVGLTISIDGGSPSIYSQYRRKGDFNAVISNIRKLILYKKKYNSELPHIRWQYIIMEHNECDIINAKRIAAELGVEIDFKLTWDSTYSPTQKNIEMLRYETGLEVFTRNEYLKKYSKVYLGYLQCRQMFLSPQINWDGRLLGCCGLYKEDYGVNVFEVGLRVALKNDMFVYAKKGLISGETLSISDPLCPCYRCEKRIQMISGHEAFDPFKFIKV